MENQLKLLAKSVLIPLGLTASVSAADAGIHKNVFRFGTDSLELTQQKTLIISNEEIEDVMKQVKFPEESGLLKNSVSKTNTNEQKR